MHLLALLLIAALSVLYAASRYEFEGYWWADQACSGTQFLCDSPEMLAVLLGAVAVGYVLWILYTPQT